MQNRPTLPDSNEPVSLSNWQTRNYAAGLAFGAVLGLISAHLFNRAAEENDDGKPAKVSTGTLLGLTLSLIALIRQIAESGRPRKK